MAGFQKWVKASRPDQLISQVAKRALKQRFKAVHHYLELASLRAEDDSEHVHQLRVSTRRAAAALQIFGHLLPSKHVRKIRKQLKQIRRAASRARDLDVLKSRLLDLQGKIGAENLDRVSRQVDRLRSAAQLPLTRIRKRLRREEFRKQTRRMVKRVRWNQAGREPLFSETAPGALQRLVDDFFQALETGQVDLEHLHHARIRGKRLRYGMELLNAAFCGSFREQLYPVFQQVQQQLGDINDHATARVLFCKWITEFKNPEAVGQVADLISDEKRAMNAKVEAFWQWMTEERTDQLRDLFDAMLNDAHTDSQPEQSTHRERKVSRRHLVEVSSN